MPDDNQNILDVITAVNFDLRHTQSFRVMLHPLDEAEARRIAQAYIDFLCREMVVDQGTLNINLPPKS
jgi:hypothetical protein